MAPFTVKSWFPLTACLLLSISSVAYGVPTNENLNSLVIRGTLPPKFKPQPKNDNLPSGSAKNAVQHTGVDFDKIDYKASPDYDPDQDKDEVIPSGSSTQQKPVTGKSHPRAVVEVKDRNYHPEDSVYDLVQRALGVTPSQVAANKNAPVQKQGPSTQALTDVLRKIGSPPDGQFFIPSIVECYNPRHRDRFGRPLIW